MSDFVNRYESDNMRREKASVRDCMGYFPLRYERTEIQRDAVARCPQPPKDEGSPRRSFDIDIHISRGVRNPDARNDFRYMY